MSPSKFKTPQVLIINRLFVTASNKCIGCLKKLLTFDQHKNKSLSFDFQKFYLLLVIQNLDFETKAVKIQ